MKIRYTFLLLFSIISWTSCQQDDKLSQKTDIIKEVTGEDMSDVVTDEAGNSYSLVKGIENELDSTPKTRITYSEPKVDLGEVIEGTKVKHAFEFKNTGNLPLIIQSAHGSCGCTVADYPKQAIAPGENGNIAIEFDSEGRLGSNTKTVTVVANTQPNTTELFFSVKVNPKK
ncbi:MAG: DUF1573 domain-containing protein [Chitinophagales bacterium]|nr:DUF1573 domain-containing protein [Chitinophagales bacterium]MCZ2393843.1 DUF1573 domain-containing protein [Chitinophagales bacterium]